MKPHCTHFRERFSEYLDGLLTHGELAEVDAHLADCPDCRRELERWRATLQAVGGLPRRAAPEGFRGRVMARLPLEAAPGGQPAPPQRRDRPRLFSLYLRAMPVAAMLLLVFGVVAVVQRNGALTPRPRLVAQAPLTEAAAQAGPVAPAAPARDVVVTTSAGVPAGGPAMGYGNGGGGYAFRPAAREDESAGSARNEPRLGGRVATGQQNDELARRGDLGAARAAIGTTYALKGQAAASEAMPSMRAAAPLAGNELVFRQTQALPRAVERPEQVLTLYSADPADLIRRAIEAANGQGLEVTLVFRPGGRADISVQVPPARYEPLVTALSNLAAPESQSLSNSALAQGDFFRKALDDYNASNRLRQKEQQGQAMLAALPRQMEERMQVAEAGDVAGGMAGGRAPAAGSAVRANAVPPAAMRVPAPAAGPAASNAPAQPTSRLEAARAMAEEKPSTDRLGGEAPPSVVNLQITIEPLPVPRPPAR